MKYNSFITDKEKMYDFFELEKDEFLGSYSYLDEKDYDLTALALSNLKFEFQMLVNDDDEFIYNITEFDKWFWDYQETFEELEED